MRGNKLFRRAAFVTAISMLPSLATAAGLGKINVMSALGQPLVAEIDLVSVSAEEFPSLAARLASQEAYREANVEFPNATGGFRFAIDKRANGQPYLKVNTNQPVNEPFLDLLIELNWASGRLLREYPVLLDPPGYNVAKSAAPAVTAPQAEAAPAPTAAPRKPSATVAAPAASAVNATKEPVRPTGKAASAKPAAQSSDAADTYGPVKSGQTLREIAESVRPAEVTLDQMLVSLYRENKGAFIGRNMNRLKTGMILKVPESTAIAAIAPVAAKREVVAQTADWQSYRKRVANIAASGATQGEKSGQSAAGAIDTKISDAKAPPETGKDVLKLSKGQGDAAKAGATGKGAAGDKLNAMQEEVVARDRALEDAKTRISDLEKQIGEMRRLLELKGSPALPQKPAVTAKAPEPAPVEKSTATVVPVMPKAEPAVKPAPEVKPALESKPEADSKPPVDEKPAMPSKPKRVMTPPPPLVAEPGLLDGLLENPLIPAAGAAVLGLLGFLGYRQFRKRKDAQLGAFTATGAIPGGFKVGQGAAPSPATLTPDGGNSSFLSDFDKVGAGNIDTDEVDPVAEADVYIAYGRDAQAEEILKEAMVKDSSRYEIPLKLLEIYSNRKSAQSFETVAKQLHSTIGAQHPLWTKVAEMGRKLDATNAFYAAGNAPAAPASPMESTVIRAVNREAPLAPAYEDVPKAMRDTLTVKEPEVNNAPLDLDLDFDATASEPKSGISDNLSPNTGTLDLDLGGFGDHSVGDIDLGDEKPASGSDPFVLDFDLETPTKESATAKHHHEVAAELHGGDGGLDFDLGTIDEPAKPKAAASLAASSVDLPSLDLSDIDLSLGSASEAAPRSGGLGGGWQSAETKLDLARAYLEIGDKVGAVEILQEVIKEGLPEQRDEAKKLAAQA